MNNDSTTILPEQDTRKTAHEEDSQETAQSLELAIAQISMSLQEADESVGDLIKAITTMSGCVRRIEGQTDTADIANDTARYVIRSENRQVQLAMQQAVTAFQFYDRLSQRFLHIQENLRAVANVIQAPDQQHHSLWQDLHEKVRSFYSLEQEKNMYQALLNGLSAEDGRKTSAPSTAHNSNDIELF